MKEKLVIDKMIRISDIMTLSDITLEFLLIDPSVRKVFPFCNTLGNAHKSTVFPRKREIRQEATARKRYTGLIQSSWESCFLQLLSTSIPIKLYFQVTSSYECPMFGAFFQGGHVDPRVYSLEFGGIKN